MKPLFTPAAALAGALFLIAQTGCATRGPSPSTERASQDQTLRTQIFLDSRGFGPGVVDGRPGEFTVKAMAIYQQSGGLSADPPPDTGNIEPYSSYSITDKDLGAVGTMASGPKEQSKQEKLPYTSLL